jgi:hypothetical protein
MSTQVTTTTSFHEATYDETPLFPEDAPKHVCSKHLKKQQPDIYGQKHPIETIELIQDSLILLENEMWNLPEEDVTNALRASIECPEVFESKEHRLMFLRCEQFNVDVSKLFDYV